MTGENAKGESKNLPVTRITARGILIGSLLLTLDHVLVHLSHTLPLLLAHLLGFLGPRRFGGASLGLDGAGGGGGCDAPGLEVRMRKGAVNLFFFYRSVAFAAAGGGVTSGGEKASGWIFFLR